MNNQTNQEHITNSYQNDLGTGIFLLADVESENYGAAKKVFVQNITYSECIKRGQFTMAFKWIPDSLGESLFDLQSTSCDSLACVKSCVKKGCICNEHLGICQ